MVKRGSGQRGRFYGNRFAVDDKETFRGKGGVVSTRNQPTNNHVQAAKKAERAAKSDNFSTQNASFKARQIQQDRAKSDPRPYSVRIKEQIDQANNHIEAAKKAEAKGKSSPTAKGGSGGHGGNPYHDDKGRFTSK